MASERPAESRITPPNRRTFLARSLRTVAALPFLGGLATLAGATEPEAQGTMETIYEYASVGYDEGGFMIGRYVGGVYQGSERLGPAVRSILVRVDGWGVRRLTTPWLVR